MTEITPDTIISDYLSSEGLIQSQVFCAISRTCQRYGCEVVDLAVSPNGHLKRLSFRWYWKYTGNTFFNWRNILAFIGNDGNFDSFRLTDGRVNGDSYREIKATKWDNGKILKAVADGK